MMEALGMLACFLLVIFTPLYFILAKDDKDE